MAQRQMNPLSINVAPSGFSITVTCERHDVVVL
jgi:hypothetical protein